MSDDADDLEEMREKLERAEFSVSCAKCSGQIVATYDDE